jgi:hypothetical protein
LLNKWILDGELKSSEKFLPHLLDWKMMNSIQQYVFPRAGRYLFPAHGPLLVNPVFAF